MKLKIFCTAVLLVFCLLLFTSCNKAERAYNSGRYQQALEILDSKQNPGKEDYLLKAKTLNSMGRQEEARESILLYMILADSSDEREFASNLFIDLRFSDVLNVLLLRPSDGIKAQITLYKSYASMEDYDRAKVILSDYLSTNLSVEEFITLIVNYPVEPDYVVAFLTAWLPNLNIEQKALYLELLQTFSEYENLTENSVLEGVDITDKMLLDGYYTSDNARHSAIYKIRARFLTRIFDVQDADLCYRKAYSLNPDDPQLKDMFKDEI